MATKKSNDVEIDMTNNMDLYRILKVGAKVLCMTGTTHYWVGRVLAFDALSIVLDDSGWVPDLGRHNEAMKTGKFQEFEPHYGPMEIPRIGTVVLPYNHELPKVPK